MEKSADAIRRRMAALRSSGEGADEDVIVLEDVTPVTVIAEEMCDEVTDDSATFGVPHVCAHVRTDYEDSHAPGQDATPAAGIDEGESFEEDLAALSEAPDESMPPLKNGLRPKHKLIMALGLSLLAAGGYMAWYLSYAVANEKATKELPGASMLAPPKQLPLTSVRSIAPVATQQQLSSSERTLVPEGQLKPAPATGKPVLVTEPVQAPKAAAVVSQKDSQPKVGREAPAVTASPVRKKNPQSQKHGPVPLSHKPIQAENAEMKAAFSADGWEPAEFTGIGAVSVKSYADTTIVKVTDARIPAAMSLLAAKSRSHFPCAGSHCFVLPNKVLATK